MTTTPGPVRTLREAITLFYLLLALAGSLVARLPDAF
jgi:hypothetical protein